MKIPPILDASIGGTYQSKLADFCVLCSLLMQRNILVVPARFELANESFAGILTTTEKPRDTNHFLIRLLQNDNHLLIILRSINMALTTVFLYPLEHIS